MSDKETQTINIRFAGDFASGLEFVEIENEDGESIGVGEWDVGQKGAVLQLEADQ